jgi:ribonuclease P protein component
MAAQFWPAAAPVGAINSRSATRLRFIPDHSRTNSVENSRKSFPKSARLLRSSDFRKIYDSGKRYTCAHFAAFYLAQPDAAGPHIGFTTPRALGRAVLRNRVKRRFREAVRLHLAELSPQWSVVINPRRSSLNLPFPDLEREIGKLFGLLSSKALPGSLPASSAYIK